MAKLEGKHTVMAINPQYINEAASNTTFRRALNDADLLYADGIGIVWAMRLFGYTVPERAATTDLLPLICEQACRLNLRIYFLGGQPGIAEQAAEMLKVRFNGLSVVGWHHGYFSPSDELAIIEEINRCQTDILFVGMGVPREQIWVWKHRGHLRVSVVMTCGGLFDFHSGRVRRAPLWTQKLGLEWLYRLIQEPRRLYKRYLIGNPEFILRTIVEYCNRFRKKRTRDNISN